MFQGRVAGVVLCPSSLLCDFKQCICTAYRVSQVSLLIKRIIMIFSLKAFVRMKWIRVHHKAYSTVTVDTQKLASSTVSCLPCSPGCLKERLPPSLYSEAQATSALRISTWCFPALESGIREGCFCSHGPLGWVLSSSTEESMERKTQHRKPFICQGIRKIASIWRWTPLSTCCVTQWSSHRRIWRHFVCTLEPSELSPLSCALESFSCVWPLRP